MPQKTRMTELSVALAAAIPALWANAAPLVNDEFPLPIIEKFESFEAEAGIPTHKVHAVLKTSEGKLWIGTWDGLCVREPDGKFRRFSTEHGLSHKMVLCLPE